ncbi:GNAT family N-acetyltransferase [Neptunitalea lumnitzerae]|uniref:N-acetyltransferase n=1 Tax=Neptunitalea lumnitzerae TaxID=2965509 RepID=A0ABQ5MEW6_9FLAO|nr:GNAT family protein [Neptunitalea sp. Y10]GLB47861.1 N-acetyltransferase [Neptunitalea sp. Y10]
MENWTQQPILEHNTVQLIPMEISHKEALLKAASDGELWDLWYTSVPSEDTIENYMGTALKHKETGYQFPYVVIYKPTNTIIGTTRFDQMDPSNRRLELGYTWYAKSYQRTAVNSECKYLMLQLAFEKLNCIAVQISTNWHNHQSRAAIARLGAKQDGVIRNHRINTDGSYRDTVIFSITNSEWISVKKNLLLNFKKHNNSN